MAETKSASDRIAEEVRPSPPDLVLASASQVRLAILRAAGLSPAVEPAHVDETEIKDSFRAAGMDAAAVAQALAELKAVRVSQRRAGALVIGADQMLDCEGDWFDKPADMAQARRQLLALRGRSHMLHTGACVALNGSAIWQQGARARLTMRDFSEAFLDAYLAAVGEPILATVGGYAIEGPGVQLFASIQGDHFVIRGLPLLPLLDFLRGHGIIAR
jgi:septum formation protein